MHFATLIGGLGDNLLGGFAYDQPLGKFQDFKAKHPDQQTRLIVASTAPIAARALFELNPHIDHLVTIPLDASHLRQVDQAIDGATPLEDVENLTWHRPELHLCTHDMHLVNGLKPLASFLSVHPFAGSPDRSLVQTLHYGQLRAVLDAITQVMPVVLLGASHRRTLPAGEMHLEENLDSIPGVINLLGQPIRVQAAIASQSTGFLGSVSCWHCLATAFEIPCFVFAPKHLDGHIDGAPPGVFGMMREQKQKVVYFEEMPDDLEDQLKAFLTRLTRVEIQTSQ